MRVVKPLVDLWHEWTTPDATITCTILPSGEKAFEWEGGQIVGISRFFSSDLGIVHFGEVIQIGPYRLRLVAMRLDTDNDIFTLDAPNAFWYVWRVKLLRALVKLVVRLEGY